MFFLTYIFLATWTYGLYVPSGLFVPTILCGAAWGRLFGDCVYGLFPKGSWSGPGIYALVGAAAMLGELIYSFSVVFFHINVPYYLVYLTLTKTEKLI